MIAYKDIIKLQRRAIERFIDDYLVEHIHEHTQYPVVLHFSTACYISKAIEEAAFVYGEAWNVSYDVEGNTYNLRFTRKELDR